MNYHDFVKNYMGVDESRDHKKYSGVGHTFCQNQSEELEGLYWYYQGDDFVVDIHDFYIKKELVHESTSNMLDYMSIYTSYLISANGENFAPYQTLTSDSLYTLDLDHVKKNFRFLLHENSYYLAVAIGYKRSVLEKHISPLGLDPITFFTDLFLNNEVVLAESLKPVALDILNCNMASPAAELFFRAKADEWISIVIDTFLKNQNTALSPNDEEALANVAKYLDDHFAMNVKQETLEKISMMSGTKLKRLFKKKYRQSITEYTQRKRMNIAEMLITHTNLTMKEIAESVGYASHSKFSAYYKRYKGQYPNDLRKLVQHSKKTQG